MTHFTKIFIIILLKSVNVLADPPQNELSCVSHIMAAQAPNRKANHVRFNAWY
jgi:hypothetical protein